MKIVFSRKGFDGGRKSGRGASAILPSGEMMSLPIPGKKPSDLICYGGIRAPDGGGVFLQERIEQLREGEAMRGRQWGPPSSVERCHHDPDLVLDSRDRPSTEGWTGIFGQSKIWQGHLRENGVGVGDLFLFFGWFRGTELENGKLRFRKEKPRHGQHMLFGYLQVAPCLLEMKEGAKIPRCFSDHPHLNEERFKLRKAGDDDSVYIAREKLLMPDVCTGLPGYGVFRHAPELVLTEDKKRRSFWNLPSFFDGQFCGKYGHREMKGPHKGCIRIPNRGQEFIVNGTPEIQEWALERIRAGMGID